MMGLRGFERHKDSLSEAAIARWPRRFRDPDADQQINRRMRAAVRICETGKWFCIFRLMKCGLKAVHGNGGLRHCFATDSGEARL
jgi:hypothetical protein